MIPDRGNMGVIRIFLWLIYEFNKYAMNLYWILYLRWWFDGNIEWFAHVVGVLSFFYMLSNIVYLLSGQEA